MAPRHSRRRRVLSDCGEKFRTYAESFGQPISLGTVYDAVLDQVAGPLWDLAPLESDSGTGKLAKKVVDEFGESFLKKYLEMKLQQAIVRLATSAGPYDPAKLAEELRTEELAVPRMSARYQEYVDAATQPLVNCGGARRKNPVPRENDRTGKQLRAAARQGTARSR